MSATKIFLGTTVGAGLIWLAAYLSGKKKTGDKLDTETKVNVHSVKLNGLTLRIDVILKNPTEGTLTIRQPYVRVLFDKKLIGTSTIKNTLIDIPGYGVKALDAIYLTIPATGLLTLGDGLFKVLLKKQPAKITAITISSVKLGGKFVPYEKAELYNIKPKA